MAGETSPNYTNKQTYMKVEVTKEENKMEREYPYLGETEFGLVVLFTEINKGTVLKAIEGWDVGGYHEDWNPEAFTPFEGRVILQNK